MWKNIVKLCKPQLTIWRKCIACWIPKVTNTFWRYTVLIDFRLQQKLQKCASMLRHS